MARHSYDISWKIAGVVTYVTYSSVMLRDDTTFAEEAVRACPDHRARRYVFTTLDQRLGGWRTFFVSKIDWIYFADQTYHIYFFI